MHFLHTFHLASYLDSLVSYALALVLGALMHPPASRLIKPKMISFFILLYLVVDIPTHEREDLL